MEIATALGTQIALSALSSVINKLGTYLGGDVTSEEMEHLKYFLLSEISVFIEEGKSNDFVQSRPLLDMLQEAALQVDDLLDLYEYNQIKKQVSSSSTNFIKKLVPILKEKLACILPKSSLRINLEKLLNFVEQLEKKHPFIKLDKTNGQQTQQKYKSPDATTSTPTSPYFGRVEQRETIIKLLLDESHVDINEVPVIFIKGMGGSGKSLTAQLVCKDKRITDYFGEPIWVHVTTDFDVEKLTKKIIESANNEECHQSSNLELLQKSLKESVKKRKIFLLVLDDVWCDDKNKWDQLVGPLNEVGEKGSKIIVTTREAGVAQLQRGKGNVISLDELEVEDCWSILKYYAFNDSKHDIKDPELVNAGNQIISNARSSPLALKVVGSSLHDTTSVNEWKKFLKRDILKKTMDLLSFSFQRLPSHLQRCFAYCSLFPKGYVHKEHFLVPLWIAQGYLIENTNENLTLEEKGNMYIDDLLSYSFFEKKDSSDNFVIHDLLHDLAERASRNICHRIEHYDSLMNIPPKCIHLSMHTTVDFKSIEISDISKLRNLRSLIILDDAHCTNIFRENTGIFQILSKLRALYVGNDYKMEVLSNPHIDQLKHLRYLHLYSKKKLPESLTKLYHLQFFNLKVASIVIEHSNGYRYLVPNILPQGFGNLINLRTIKIRYYLYDDVDYLKYNSKVIDIGKLKSLQNVPVFYPEKDNVNGMVPLKDLPLCGSLIVCDLENVKSKGDAEKAMLKQKKNLNVLILEWGSNTAGGSNELETCEEVLEGLEPHQNLKSLRIKGYKGVKIANWMVRKNLHLHSLTLIDCESIREINFLPPSLRKLKLINCPVLRRLQSMPNNSISLEYLIVEKCPMLMSDERSLLVEKVAERDTANLFSQAEIIDVDEPLLVLVLVQQQGFSSINRLRLCCTEAKPFPLLLEDQFSEFSSLQWLYLHGIKTLPNMEKLSALKELTIENCGDVELLPNLPKSLNWLYIEGCPKLKTLPNMEKLPALEVLNIYNCLDVELLPNLPKSLNKLRIVECHKLKTLPNMEKLSALERLEIVDCGDVELLPNLTKSLNLLAIRGCPKLKVNYNKEDGPLYKTISHIPDVDIYD